MIEIPNPPQHMINAFRHMAYVSQEERDRIMRLEPKFRVMAQERLKREVEKHLAKQGKSHA